MNKLLKKPVAAWNEFFFEEGPTEGLALFRIVWMGLIFLYFLLDLPNLSRFYGPEAIVSLSTARAQLPFLHANLFNLFSPGYEATYAILAVYGISLVASIFGLFTRTSLVLALMCMTSLHQRNIWLLSSSEMLMRLITLYLIFSPCGHTLSIDSLLSKYFPQFKKKRTWPLWSMRLIQIQISVVYLWTFWHKTKGNTWIDGSAVYYATRLEFMKNFSIPLLLDSYFVLKLLTWSTLAIEFALGFFIWFKDYRKYVIFLGIMFHLGIEFIMTIPFFELYMIALFINFIPPQNIKHYIMNLRFKFANALQDSSVAVGFKEQVIRTIRGEHEPVN
jgi:hypothetical protein